MPSDSDFALLKKSVRADDFDDDDTLLHHYLDAAESYVLSLTNREEEDLRNQDGTWPSDLLQAIIMLAGHWYNQREAASGVAMSEVPFGVMAICKRYRKLVDQPVEKADGSLLKIGDVIIKA